MSVILALDPGYLRTRVAVARAGSVTVRTVAAGQDPVAFGASFAGAKISAVVVPAGPPVLEYPWHPRCVAAKNASSYCEDAGIPLIVAGRAAGPLPPVARPTGFPGRDRRATFYDIPEEDAFLSAAGASGISAATARMVVVYAGEETSVSARAGGEVIDSSDPAGCEGPFGLTSAGTMPATAFVSYVSSADMPYEKMRDKMKSSSGAFAYAGVDSLEALGIAATAGNAGAVEAISGMAYQISKEIGRMAASLRGDVHRVVLCGPGAGIESLVQNVSNRVEKWAPLHVIFGDLVIPRLVSEGMRALALNL